MTTKAPKSLFNIENTPVYVRHPHERVRVHPKLVGESRTHQSHADSCDINNVIKRFENTGELPPATREAQYADVTQLQGDLTERINTSRATLDAAGRDLESKQKAKLEEEQAKQTHLETEIERLKSENEALQATAKPSQEG